MNQKSYLIIDDDVIFGNKLMESFNRRGMPASYAQNLPAATLLVKKGGIDRVILDLKLDDANGLSFLGELRLKPELEILVLTGYGSISTVKHALKNGAVNYLQKPASVEEIVQGFEATGELAEDTHPTLDSVEADYINRVLVEQNGNVSKSAKILGLHRRSLQRKLKNK